MIRAVVRVDATVASPHWQSDWHARTAVDELIHTVPPGTLVRLHVVSLRPPWPASLYDDAPRVDPLWAEFVERFSVEITGTRAAVQGWTEALNRCVTTPPAAGA
jgi:hypothetical protein